MRKIILELCSIVLALTCSSTIEAVAKDTVNGHPAPQYSSEGWVRQSVAVVRILDKLEAHTERVEIPVGQSIRYKTLTIEAQDCVVRPPSLPSDSAAFLQITDVKLTSLHFAAWILASEPGVSVFEHPLYNVSVVGCTGEENSSPSLTIHKQSVSPKKEPSDQSDESLEKSLENSLHSQH